MLWRTAARLELRTSTDRRDAQRQRTCTGAGGARPRRHSGAEQRGTTGTRRSRSASAALLLALVSPIAYFDTTLQWDHMVQHVLLLLVAPPLILLARSVSNGVGRVSRRPGKAHLDRRDVARTRDAHPARRAEGGDRRGSRVQRRSPLLAPPVDLQRDAPGSPRCTISSTSPSSWSACCSGIR